VPGSKAEAAIGAAEANVRLRAQVLALQADAVKLREFLRNVNSPQAVQKDKGFHR
jgi:hypothetical protein